MNGRSAGMAMEVFNGIENELMALVMFVVDASQPFSTPAKLPETVDQGSDFL